MMKNQLDPENILKKASESRPAPLSEAKKEAMLSQIFETAKPKFGLASLAAAYSTLFTARFGQLALRAIISTLVIVLLVGGVWVAAPAPVAFGSEKGHTVEVARTADLRVVFDGRMDKGSVEKAFTIAPPMQGTFEWNDNMLTFKPSVPLEKGMTYEVTVGTDAQNIFGKNLKVPYRQWFAVKDDPEVSAVAPADNSEIRTNQTLTVIFDHPIRNLTGSLAVPNFLTIEPKVAGKYNWLGTSGFEFVPSAAGWTPATDFTVTVPSDFTFADGSKLENAYTWKFRTADLSVSMGGNIQHHRTKEPIELNFSFPVKADEITKSVIIKENGNVVPLSNFIQAPASGLTSNVKFTPRGVLKLGSTYSIELQPGFTGGVGTRPMPNNFSAGFTMDEAGFKLVATCPGDGETKEIWDSVVIGFNNPIEGKGVKSFVSVSPELKGLEVYTEGWSNDTRCRDLSNRMISVGGQWKASTKYTVTLKSGLKDIYGQVLDGGKTFSFTTEAHEPSLDLSSYSDQGVLSAYLPRLYQARIRNFSQPLTVELESYDGTIKVKREYETSATLNMYKVVDVDLDNLAGKRLPNGQYMVTFRAPDLPYAWNRTIVRRVVIADTALTVKRDNAGKIVVWATDLESGNVVNDLAVKVNGNERKTNSDGLVEFPNGTQTGTGQYEIIASGGGRFGLVRQYWNEGISPWNYNIQQSYGNRLNGFVGTIYTDRRIYRPDQKVFFKGIIRQDFDARYELPKFGDVNVTIKNPGNQTVYEARVPVSQYGSFQSEFQMDSSMQLGDYRIAIAPTGTDDPSLAISGYFTVAEFRRPDFKVTVTPPDSAAIQGTPLLVNIRSEYYSGAPLANGKVTYTVTRRRMDFQPLDGEWFNFSDADNSDCYWYCRTEGDFENVMTGTKDLNVDGVYAISIPTALGDYKGNAMYAIEVTVEDVNHRTVSGRAEMPVYRGEYSVGVRPNYDGGWMSSSLDFDIVSVNNDGSLKAGVPGSAKLYRRVWTNAQKENIDGSTFWDSTPSDTFVTSSLFVTGMDGRTKVGFNPEGDGEYFVIIESRDSRGNALTARATRYLYRGGSSTIRVTDDHMLKIVQNKADYKVGDTASLVIQTPYENTKALVTVERETIREYRVVDLGTTNRTIEIPINEAAVPNIFVSVTTVKGGVGGVPEFRMGYADLRVGTTSKVLDIDLTTDKKEYKPGDTVTLTVKAKKRDGTPQKAEISIAVVDERIVSLMGSIDKNILGAFWFRRQIGVETLQTLTKLVKKVFISTGEFEGDGKGGGDTAVPVRGNFQDTAYWKADVETNANGTATVTFKLPDNLTNWQILAIGNTKDTVVGAGELMISTRNELTIEPLLPRFVRYGDTVKLGASVENGSGIAKNVEVKIKAEGLNVTDGLTKTIYVPARSRLGITWNIKVPYDADEAKITVTGIAGGISDGFEMKIPVLPYSVAEIVTASNILEKNATETVEIPDNILANQSEIRVAVSPNIGQGITSGIDYLLKYEYGCAEQTASAVLAGTIYDQLVKLQLANGTPEQLNQAKEKVNAGIQKTLAMQKQNGGFGFWNDSKSTYPHLTAYVTWTLYQAKQAGFTVDQSAIDRASDYLMGYLSAPASTDYSWLGPSEKAQVIFVLSEFGKPKLSGYADGVYEARSSLSVFGKSFLAMAYKNIDGKTSAKTTELMKSVENSIVYLDPSSAYVHENDGYGYFMSSDLRTTGISLMAYLRLSPNHENTERFVRWIMRQKTGGYWETTQNTGFALLSLIEYAKLHPIDTKKVDVTVFLNSAISNVLTLPQGDRSGEVAATYRVNELLAKGKVHQFGLEKDSSKRYFYDISMKVFRQIEDIDPFENGFSVISETFAKDDKNHEKPLTSVSQGDVVRVRMKLIVPKRRQYVAFEHHLPAGLEAIDFQLRTSNQSLNNDYGKGGGCSVDLSGYEYCIDPYSWEYNWWWENVWKHTELRDDRVFLFAEDIQPGMYEYEFFAQAVTVGEYRLPPARAYEMYTPTANGHNEGKIFRVLDK